MAELKTAVIMAGGKGTRLSSITGVFPKPMVKVRNLEDTEHNGEANDTILAHQIDMLSQEGITDFIFVVGNKKGFIQHAFTNEKINNLLPGRNISIRYFEEQEHNPLGTGGSFCSKDLQRMIGKDDFLLTYADVLFDVNVQDMFKYHLEQKADATMVVGPVKEPDDRVLCYLGEDGSEINRLLQKQGKGEAPRGCAFPNIARNGMTIFNSRLFEILPEECTYMDMETDILSPMVYNSNYRVCAWTTPCYVKDIGTVERYWEGVKDLEQGLPQIKNPVKTPQSCVIFREQDLIQDEKLNLDTARSILELNEKGVIVGLQGAKPKLPLETTLETTYIDTALVRQCNGAYVNFKFGEEDIEPLIKAMRDWRISEDRTYVIEKVVDNGYLISNFAKGDQSFQLSSLASAYFILERIENEKAEQALQSKNIHSQQLEDDRQEGVNASAMPSGIAENTNGDTSFFEREQEEWEQTDLFDYAGQQNGEESYIPQTAQQINTSVNFGTQDSQNNFDVIRAGLVSSVLQSYENVDGIISAVEQEGIEQ